MRTVLLVTCVTLVSNDVLAEESKVPRSFRTENLVAWCIVPFDAKHRGPAERAAMVRQLGLRRVAYDWREEHVATFEEEILQYKEHGIEFFAFWSWHDAIEPLIRKYEIHPQIWKTCPSPDEKTQKERVNAAVKAVLPLVAKAKTLGLKFGLYNHGGWGGEPRNLIAVCKRLRHDHNANHVGIVYNFHHGHGHIDDFTALLDELKPYLLCLNLNGMRDAANVKADTKKNKIIPIDTGRHEAAMIRSVIEKKYAGPIGVLGHRADVDVAEALQMNLDGLQRLLNRLHSSGG